MVFGFRNSTFLQQPEGIEIYAPTMPCIGMIYGVCLITETRMSRITRQIAWMEQNRPQDLQLLAQFAKDHGRVAEWIMCLAGYIDIWEDPSGNVDMPELNSLHL